MNGWVYLVVGARGMGKSTFVKDKVSRVPLEARLIYDPNAEYTDLYPYPLLRFEQFLELSTRVQQAFVVYEEATIFIGHQASGQELKELLVRARHTRNTIFLVFHSLRTVPRYIFDLATHMVLFKTADPETFVDKRFEHPLLQEAFLRVKNSELHPIADKPGKFWSDNEIIRIQ
jgi:hypothetical protein